MKKHNIDQYLAVRLQERKDAGNLRQLATTRAAVDLFSNDYLGLATTGVLAQLMHPLPVEEHAIGSTGSRLLSGNSERTMQLEQTIAAFHKAEAALLFNSGYDANIGLIAAIAGRTAVILYDELCHASLIDGIRLALCNHKYRFAHNDLNDLEDKLKKHAGDAPVMVVVESVYSMDGDMAPLHELTTLCERYNAQMIVDEAHATGVIGDHGAGLVCALGLEDRVFARVHTFGKAVGCHGAAIVGSALLKDYLVNFARSFIYTTALPAHSVQAVQCAYEYFAAPAFSNKPLHDLIAYFQKKIATSGMQGWKDNRSAIQALVTGGNERTRHMATQLQQAGLQVNAILHPTVPLGMERLRICLHTFNTTSQIDLLFSTLQEL